MFVVITFSRMRDADTKQRIEIVISAVLFFIVPDICRENEFDAFFHNYLFIILFIYKYINHLFLFVGKYLLLFVFVFEKDKRYLVVRV